jgi:hypothetical protein
MPLVGPIPDTLLPLRGRYSVANKPKALSAGTPPELGTKIRTEGRAVLVSAKTMPCPNKLGPTLSHGVHAEFTQSHTECTESHTLANADQDCRRTSAEIDGQRQAKRQRATRRANACHPVWDRRNS